MENHVSSSFEAQDVQSRHLSLKFDESDDIINDSDDEQFLCGYGKYVYFCNCCCSPLIGAYRFDLILK